MSIASCLNCHQNSNSEEDYPIIQAQALLHQLQAEPLDYWACSIRNVLVLRVAVYNLLGMKGSEPSLHMKLWLVKVVLFTLNSYMTSA